MRWLAVRHAQFKGARTRSTARVTASFGVRGIAPGCSLESFYDLQRTSPHTDMSEKRHPAAAAVRERTGQPAGRPFGRDVHTDPADRPDSSGQCLQCCSLSARIVCARADGTINGTIKSCPHEGGVRAPESAHLRLARGCCAVSRRTPWRQVRRQ